MSDETDAPQGGADSAVAPEAVETTSEATTEQDTGTEETGLADDAGEEPQPKKVPWFQKRINEVTAKVYEKERETAYWRGIAEGRGQPQAQAQPEAATLPTLEQFDYDEAKHLAALAKHFREEAEKGFDTRLTQREQAAAESQKNETAINKLRDGGSKYPDFVAAMSGIPATEAIRDFALAEPRAADVLYDLGRDTAATERFNSLSPYQQAIELGRLAATPKANTRTIAPPPPQTVAGIVSGIGKTPDQMSMSEYATWVKERDKT